MNLDLINTIKNINKMKIKFNKEQSILCAILILVYIITRVSFYAIDYFLGSVVRNIIAWIIIIILILLSVFEIKK